MRRRLSEDFEEVFEEEIVEEQNYSDEFERDLDSDGISPEEEGFLRGEREAQDY